MHSNLVLIINHFKNTAYQTVKNAYKKEWVSAYEHQWFTTTDGTSTTDSSTPPKPCAIAYEISSDIVSISAAFFIYKFSLYKCKRNKEVGNLK